MFISLNPPFCSNTCISYETFNYIYYPGYKSFFCDNEFMKVAYKLNRQTYIHDVIIKHEHPANNKNIAMDPLYIENNECWDMDKALYTKRNKKEVDLSVLICSIPQRQKLLDVMLFKINTLVQDVNISVEILYDNSVDYDLVTKRNLLLFKSSGKYCCFIDDDDDDITNDYFAVVDRALSSNIDYDCGNYFVNGIFRKPFHHSIKHASWYETSQGYFRCPNHLNVIKTDICKQIKFKRENHQVDGEDIRFSRDLLRSKLNNHEYYHDTIMYHYFKLMTEQTKSPPVKHHLSSMIQRL